MHDETRWHSKTLSCSRDNFGALVTLQLNDISYASEDAAKAAVAAMRLTPALSVYLYHGDRLELVRVGAWEAEKVASANTDLVSQ